ncbi:MAG: universal stress protein [Armatimonadota bacterium]|jgi:nucleotide-binding universal stress UspA family protein|nr:universal stress protein [Armatimonadota bacterium]
MFKEILVPLDGSELAEKAIPYAVELAKKFDSRITLLSVIEPVAIYSQPGIVGPVVNVVLEPEAEAQEVHKYLDKISTNIKDEGINVRKVVRQGDAAGQICDFSKEAGIELIVMSTHGRSGFQRWVYGSVADKVLRGAEALVLLVRARPKEAEK